MIAPRLVLSMLMACAAPILASELHIGNLAPSTPEGGTVRFEVGEQSAVLDYRIFTKLVLEPGTYVVRAFDGHDGPLLAERNIQFEPEDALTPVLYFAGNGTGRAFYIGFDQHSEMAGMPPPPLGARVSFVLHHVAPVAEDNDAQVRLEIDCPQSATAPPEVIGRIYRDIDFGALWRDVYVWGGLDSANSITCEFVAGAALIGGFHFSLHTSPSVATRRAFLIGDGDRHAPQVLVMDGSERIELIDLPAPHARALSSSRDHWFDVVRPDQGLSLFEVGGTGVVFGTWFTFGDDNQPTWYYVEGAKVQGIGRRDVTIYAGSRATDAQSLMPVGSARLQYLDCNEAEFRALLGETDLRTVRMRRSQPASFCPVFD